MIDSEGRALLFGSGSYGNGPHVAGDALVRINRDGGRDSGFHVSVHVPANVSAIQVLALQPDGKILIGGGFDAVDETAVPAIARLNPDGSLDPTFAPADVTVSPFLPPAGSVTFLGAQPGGKVIVEGYTSVPQTGRYSLLQLRPDGSVSPEFAGFSNTPPSRAILLQPDGKILVNSSDQFTRLNADGSPDPSFELTAAVMNGFSPFYLAPDGRFVGTGMVTSPTGSLQQVLVLNGDPRPLLLQATLVRSTFQATLNTEPGRNYVFETSTDLRGWSPLRTNTAPGYSLLLQDANATGSAHLFYRSRVLMR